MAMRNILSDDHELLFWNDSEVQLYGLRTMAMRNILSDDSEMRVWNETVRYNLSILWWSWGTNWPLTNGLTIYVANPDPYIHWQKLCTIPIGRPIQAVQRFLRSRTLSPDLLAAYLGSICVTTCHWQVANWQGLAIQARAPWRGRTSDLVINVVQWVRSRRRCTWSLNVGQRNTRGSSMLICLRLQRVHGYFCMACRHYLSYQGLLSHGWTSWDRRKLVGRMLVCAA